MKRRFAVTFALLCILSLLSGCASVVLPAHTTAPKRPEKTEPCTTAAPETEPEQNTMTAEEVAMQFMESSIENDPERFSECVPPVLLEEWLSSFHVDGEDHELQVNEIHTVSVETISDDDVQEISEDLGVKFQEGRVVTVYAKYTNFYTAEEKNTEQQVLVFRSENRWYGIGWS